MKEETPTYSNKMEQPPILIKHKACKRLVIKIDGVRLWCETCQAYVEAAECYHDTEAKAS